MQQSAPGRNQDYPSLHGGRQQAEKSFSQDKESWLRLAEDWAEMAHEIGRRLRPGIETEGATMAEPDKAKVMKRAWPGCRKGAPKSSIIRPRELRNEDKSDPLRTPKSYDR